MSYQQISCMHFTLETTYGVQHVYIVDDESNHEFDGVVVAWSDPLAQALVNASCGDVLRIALNGRLKVFTVVDMCWWFE